MTTTPSRRQRWAFWPFRILVTLVAVMFFLQAVFAGQFLSGTYGALQSHQNNAALTDFALFASVLAAVLVRWPGRGPWWPILAVIALLVLSYTQSELGFARTITIHIPLGVAIIMLATGLTIWAWRAKPPRGVSTPNERPEPAEEQR